MGDQVISPKCPAEAEALNQTLAKARRMLERAERMFRERGLQLPPDLAGLPTGKDIYSMPFLVYISRPASRVQLQIYPAPSASKTTCFLQAVSDSVAASSEHFHQDLPDNPHMQCTWVLSTRQRSSCLSSRVSNKGTWPGNCRVMKRVGEVYGVGCRRARRRCGGD